MVLTKSKVQHPFNENAFLSTVHSAGKNTVSTVHRCHSQGPKFHHLEKSSDSEFREFSIMTAGLTATEKGIFPTQSTMFLKLSEEQEKCKTSKMSALHYIFFFLFVYNFEKKH